MRGWILSLDDVNAERPAERSGFDGTLVHKQNLDAILVHRVTRTSADGFSCLVALPTDAEYFGGDPADLLFIAEVVRQATVFVAHAYYSVPFGHQFLMPALSIHLNKDNKDINIDPTTTIAIEMVVSASKRKGVVSSLEIRMKLRAPEHSVGQATTNALIVAPHIYRRLRLSATSQIASARSESRSTAQDLEGSLTKFRHLGAPAGPLSPTDWPAHQYLLRVDTADRFFFDHELDHVPGMLIVDAARQAVHALDPALEGPLRSLRIEFCRVIELGLRTTVTAQTDGVHEGGRVEFRQDGKLCAFGNLSR